MNEDKSQKIFPPTPHKLREARKKGQVAKSPAITSATGLVLTLGLLLLTGRWMTERIMQWTVGIIDQTGRTDGPVITESLLSTLEIIAVVSLPAVLVAFVAGVIGNVAQFGFLISAEPVKPRMQKINPVEGAKKMFSRAKFTEMLNSSIKIVVIILVTALVFRHHVQDLVYIQYHGITAAVAVGAAIIMKILAALVPLFIVLAAIDYAIKRAEFLREQRMSRYELKQEHKNTEGSPEMKQARKSRNLEDIENDVRAAAAKATVMVSDGMRLIAIQYDEQSCPVPMVTVCERGKRAQQVRRIGESKAVAVLDVIDAVIALWSRCRAGEPVPVNLYEVVAPLILQARASKAA